MEKRLLLAVLLMSAAILVTNLLFPPPEPPAKEPGADSVQVAATPPASPASAPRLSPALPAAAPARADTVVVESDLYRYQFSTRGAALIGAALKQYRSYAREGEVVQLVPEEARDLVSHRLVMGRDTIDLRRLDFRPSAPSVRVDAGAEVQSLRFLAETAGGFGVEMTYTFRPDRYLMDVRGRVLGTGGRPATLLTAVGPGLAPNEALDHHAERELAIVSRTGDDVERLRLFDIQRRDTIAGPLTWAALKDKYFLVAQIAGTDTTLQGAIARRLHNDRQLFIDGGDTTSVAVPRAELITALPVGPDGSFGYQQYIGPQDYEHLVATGYQLEDVTQYAYAWLEPVIRPFAAFILQILSFFHNSWGLAYGWVLILFGVLMRIVTWPLNAKAMRSQMKNMAIAPMMQEVKEKYKNDPQKQQEEIIRLYREHGFNPLAGCLPMLLPWPVLITLFFVFQNTIAFRGADFLWLPDLSLRDPFYILPVFLVVSMFALQWVSIHLSGMEQNPQTKMMMYFLPLMMGVLFFNLPAGLNLYYATTNIASIPQQVLIAQERRRAQEEMKQKNAKAVPAPPASGAQRKRRAKG